MKAHQKILEREKQGSNDPLYSAILLKRCWMQNNADPFLQYPKEKQTQKKRGGKGKNPECKPNYKKLAKLSVDPINYTNKVY